MKRIDLDGLSSDVDSAVLRQGLQARLQATATDWLQLDAAGSQGGLIDRDDIRLSVLAVQTAGAELYARIGVFFTEVVGGCNCHDEPARHPGYVVYELRIDRASGQIQAWPDSAAG